MGEEVGVRMGWVWGVEMMWGGLVMGIGGGIGVGWG